MGYMRCGGSTAFLPAGTCPKTPPDDEAFEKKHFKTSAGCLVYSARLGERGQSNETFEATFGIGKKTR